MKTLLVSLDKLVPDPGNTRIHSEENLLAIQASIERFGQVLPLVRHKASKIVVGGNGTVRALERLGKKKAHIVDFEGSMDEARALSIALNRTAELAEWDEDALGDALVSLQDAGFEYESLGFSTSDLEDLFPVASATAADPESPTEADDLPKPGSPIVRYDLIFDDDGQQKRFFSFLKWLKRNNPTGTTASRLDAYIGVVMAEAAS